MKLTVIRFNQKQREKLTASCMKKVITVLTGTVMTLIVCLFAEMLPQGESAGSVQTLAEPGGVSLPAVFYERVISQKSGKMPENAVLFTELAEDLRWLSDNGYSGITAEELVSFGRGISGLPEKPVLLVFGGFRNVRTDILPLLERENQKGLVVIAGSDADFYSGRILGEQADAGLSWDEIRILDQSPFAGVVSGGYDFRGETGRLFEEDVLVMQTRMNEELSHDASVFCYGKVPPAEENREIIRRMGFLAVLGEGSGSARIERGNMESLCEIPLCVRETGEKPAAFFEGMGLCGRRSRRY